VSSSIKDYYAILEVDRDCTQEDLKKAFRKKARECHPDVCEDADGEERFKDVNEAYEVLSDSSKRDVYDRFGTTDPRRAGVGGMGDVPYEDIFGMGMEDVFSMFFGGVRGGTTARVQRTGRDMTGQVVVTLEEIATGIQKGLEYTRSAPCGKCGGAGTESGTVTSCTDCGGSGRRRVVRNTILGAMQTVTTCQTCAGVGETVTEPCSECNGEGRVRQRENLGVDVPKGGRDGQVIRVPDVGEAGLRGAPSGDLRVTVRVAGHTFLVRDGDDLHVSVRVPWVTAALGGIVRVQGLYQGDEEVEIPAGTQDGGVVKVKGRGLPRLGRTTYGNLLVHVSLKTPRKLNKEQKRLLEELSESLGLEGSTERERVRDWLGK